MSDTPRTDAVELFARHMDTHREKDECRFQCMSLAPSSFARTLERELTAEQKRYDELRAILARETARGDRLEKALKEIASFGIGELRPLADEIAIWRIAKTALGDTNG